MKVLFLGKKLSGHGGMETIVKQVYDLLEKRGINVEFIFLAGGNEIDTAWLGGRRVNVIYTKYPRIFRKSRYVSLLRRKLKGKEIDFVIALDPDSCEIAKELAHEFKYKIYSWIHFSLSTMKSKHAEKIKKADLHWAISKGLLSEYKELGIAEESCIFIPNFVERQKATLLSLTNDRIKLLYMGRIQWEGDKYLKDLFEALTKVERKWSLDIVGAGEDQVQCERFISENRKKLRGDINWLGWLEKPWKALEEKGKKYNYLILPSHAEGFGMVVVEALSYGIPCICSNISPGPADFLNDRNGFLFKKGGVDVLAEILQSPLYEKSWDPQMIKESISDYYIESCEYRIFKALENQ